MTVAANKTRKFSAIRVSTLRLLAANKVDGLTFKEATSALQIFFDDETAKHSRVRATLNALVSDRCISYRKREKDGKVSHVINAYGFAVLAHQLRK